MSNFLDKSIPNPIKLQTEAVKTWLGTLLVLIPSISYPWLLTVKRRNWISWISGCRLINIIVLELARLTPSLETRVWHCLSAISSVVNLRAGLGHLCRSGVQHHHCQHHNMGTETETEGRSVYQWRMEDGGSKMKSATWLILVWWFCPINSSNLS